MSWTIDASELITSARTTDNGPAVKIQFPSEESQLRTTWDELLQSLYFGGSSRLDSGDVEPRLFLLLASKISDPSLRKTWRRVAVDNLSSKNLDLVFLRRSKRDIHRQLTGLGLIEEIVETRYPTPMPEYVNAMFPGTLTYAQIKPDSSTPVQIVVWRLTRRGEEQLALISGFRRNESD